MLQKFRFLLFYLFSWIIFFGLMRVIFLLYHWGKTKHLSFSTTLLTFWHGLRMDLSVASYILAPICIFVLLALISPFFRRKIIYIVYTGLILFFALLISTCDLEIYRAWGFRIDATPLKFLSTPREAFASVSHLPLIFIFIIFISCFFLLFWFFRLIIRRIFFQEQAKYRIVTALGLLVFMGGLIVPIRGGFQLAPLNQSSVYFSLNNYANHAAINASWNFLHSVLSKGSSGKNPYRYLSVQRDREIIDSLYADTPQPGQITNFSPGTNVIIIVWESFTEKAIHSSIKGAEVTPQFNRLKQEGIYFSNVYASGDRTNKGLPAILSGYPAMPNTTVIHSPARSEKLKVLSALFKDKGYRTPFFYGGEPEFANIKSYLLHGGFDPIVGKNDFSSKDMNSKWGAHDGVVMNRVFDDLNKSVKPFFAVWLTLSSHEPFETPVPTVFSGNDITTKFFNSLHYTDQCIADLIDKCSKQSWWDHTVMIITGDHGHYLPVTDSKADEFRIPMLWTGGAIKQKGIVVKKIMSQVDIAAMLSGEAGLGKNNFPFSKDALDSSAKQWAFFSFNDGFGFVDTSGRLIFDNIGKRIIQQEGSADEREIEAGKAMQQFTYEDFLTK